MPTAFPDGVEDEVAQIIDDLPDDVSCVATGSLMEGLGNANSDIDLYVIHDVGSVATNPIAIGIRNARYLDCEYLNAETVRELAASFADPTDLELASRSQRDFDRYYRLAIAARLIVTESVDALLDTCVSPVANRHLARWSRMHASDTLGRAAVAYSMGAVRPAVVMAREASEWRARAVLADAGEGYPSSKWTRVKAERRFGAGSPEYEDCLRGCMTTPGDVAEVIEWLRSDLNARPGVPSLCVAQAWTLTPGVQLVPHADGGVHALLGRQSVSHMSDLPARLLRALAGGESWREAVEGCAERLGLPAAEVAAAAAPGMRRLATAGLVRPGTDEGAL